MRQNIDKNGLWNEFWSRVSFPRGGRGCWLWTGRLNDKGYGMMNMYRRETFAHHVVWAMMRGSKNGLQLLHSCDVRNCVNPDHLSLGTNDDNVADRVARDRAIKVNIKLTGVAKCRAWEMRRRGMTQLAIGRELGVARNTISKLLGKPAPLGLPEAVR